MLLLVGRSLAQSPFWLPPAVIALTCWFDWESLRARKLGPFAAACIGVALLVLAVQEAQNVIITALTWNRTGMAGVTAFVRRTLPQDAVLYGPVGYYFYPVEMAGRKYLYLQNEARVRAPGAPVPLAQKIEAEICSHPTYAIWPEPDPPHQPFWAPLPEPLRARAQPAVIEFHEPPLPLWKDRLLRRLGPVGDKYGYADVAIYPLRALAPCAKK